MDDASLDPQKVRAFVIAGHHDLAGVKAMLAETPELLNVAHEWGPDDTETALAGAAHVGQAPIAEYLLSQGAPLTLTAAAMLGRAADIEVMLTEDASLIDQPGAHGIPVLAHAALSGRVDLLADLYARGARRGADMALSQAVARGHLESARWLLEHARPDLAWQDYQGRTVMQIAEANGDAAMVELLSSFA